MSERYWRGPAVTVLLAAAGAAALGGCSNSASGTASPGAHGAATGNALAAGTGQAAAAGKAGQAGQAAQGGRVSHASTTGTPGQTAITAAQLRAALLPSAGGSTPVAPPESGAYASLPDVRASRQSMKSVTVSPARCSQAASTGFDSTAFSAMPAAVVTFRVGKNGVSEVLLGANQATATMALADHLPAGCMRYQATVAGKTFNYVVQESSLAGLALQAKITNVKATGYADVNVWSLTFRANGYMGAVTMVGPQASEQAVRMLAEEAYARAAQTLR